MLISPTFLQRRPPVSLHRPAVSFASLMQAMSPQLGICLLPGPASEAYTLHANGEQDLYVMCGPGQACMTAACIAGQLPPAPAAGMLSRLLALNHQATGDIAVAVGLDVPSGSVVVSSRHMLAGMHAALFQDTLDAVRRQTRAVRQILVSSPAHA
jgi:hypothetical protein